MTAVLIALWFILWTIIVWLLIMATWWTGKGVVWFFRHVVRR